jgi:SAM-dependent methyltransferase
MTVPRDHVSAALDEVERLYSDGLQRHGASPQGVGWRDLASQRLRFAKLALLLVPPPAGPITVNDLGCGYGALLAYLDDLPGVEVSGYHGYDISEPMLRRAREATDGRAQLIRAAEPTLCADYSFVSGTFNVKGASTDAAWQQHVLGCIRRLAQTSRRGFAFNVLTSFVDFRQENLFYADPGVFFEFCKTQISPYDTLLHEYPLYEWTMIVRHPPA